MIMKPPLRKLVLSAHLTFSVGWLGAVAVFLTHAIIGLTSHEPSLVQAAYLAMELSAWMVIVPFCFGSLLTGIAQSLGTHWGLFRYYWIVVKLLLTIAITILLLVHMDLIGNMARIVSDTIISNNEYRGERIKLVVTATAAALVLFIIIIISVYKPWGKTPYGLPKARSVKPADGSKFGKFKKWYLAIGFIILALLLVLLHLFSGGMGHH